MCTIFFGLNSRPSIANKLMVGVLKHVNPKHSIPSQIKSEYIVTGEENIKTRNEDTKLFGTITIGFFSAAIGKMKYVAEHANCIDVPCYIFLAEGESLVNNESTNIVASKIPNCTQEIIPEAKHEMLVGLEKDILLDKIATIIKKV